MKARKVLAVTLACSLLFGQAVWADEPQTQEENALQPQEETEQAAEENAVPGEAFSAAEDGAAGEGPEAEGGSAGGQAAGQAAGQAEKESAAGQTAESTQPAEAAADARSEGTVQKELYIGAPQAIQYERVSSTTPQEGWSVESSDPSVCTGYVKLFPYGGTNGRSEVFYVLEAEKPGTAVITVKEDGIVRNTYSVTSAEKPDDIVVFQDVIFGWEIANMAHYTSGGYGKADTSGDGYMSREEMEALNTISLNYGSTFTDVSGLEYAVNAVTANFQEQSELVNVDALYEMENLTFIDLTGTKVSTEDRFGLAKFRDVNMKKGGTANPIQNGKFFDEPLNVECVEGDDIVIYQEEAYTSTILFAIEAGDATVRLSLDDSYADIQVHVDGISADQPVGGDSDTDITTTGGNRILASNGALWEFYPEVKKIKDDVDSYVAGWVYSGREAMEYKYYTDEDGALWSDSGKIAEDAVQYTGHYVLDSKGTLTDIYNSRKTEVSDVKKWVEYREYAGFDEESASSVWEPTTYVLKNDGTLWSRAEEGKDQAVNPFTQYASDIRDINENGYLTADGAYYLWAEPEEPAMTGVGELPSEAGSSPSYYTGLDGNAYIYFVNEYVSVGKGEITSMISAPGGYYYLMKDGNLYFFDGETHESRKADSGVAQIIPGYSTADDCYRTADGQYKHMTGETATEENPIRIYVSGQYTLLDTGSADGYMLRRNGVNILNRVKSIYHDTSVTDQILAVRTDGTVWDAKNGPAQLIDLDMTVTMGDLDNDGEVTISDLRLVLRAVCEKITLTAEQETAADVEADGKVNIQDLRKILRFVCGKIESL